MKVILYFGSFNPIHIGHYNIANFMLEASGMDQLWIIVSPHNPYKDKLTLAPFKDRLEMAKLAFADSDKIRVLDVEDKLSKPSYTINTLTYLSDEHPKNEFKILMGSDNLEGLKNWKRSKEITDNYKLIVYPRIGTEISNYKTQFNMEVYPVPIFEVSSTKIRKRIKAKKFYKGLVPTAIFEYLEKHSIYKTF